MKKVLLFLLLCLLAPLTIQSSQQKKLVLWGIKDVLLYPDMSKVTGGSLGALLGFTPDRVQQELFDTLQSLYVPLKAYTHTYPMLIEGWLTGSLSNEHTQKAALNHIKRKCSLLKKARLKAAAHAAFNPYEAARILTQNPTIVGLAQTCKKKGHDIALCSSWNPDSFNALTHYHHTLFSLFDRSYISGFCKTLASQEHFYDQILKDYPADHVYLVDCLQENLQAAKKRGITVISATNISTVKQELKRHNLI